MQNLIINEELRTLLPPLSDEEYAGLEASILKDGILSPLVVWNDMLIDGHHRYEICTKHQIPFSVTNVVLESLDDAKLWAWKHQEHRRNLTPFHRSEIALKLKDAVAAKAKERQGQRNDLEKRNIPPTLAGSKDTRQELAEIADVSHGTLNKVEYIAEHADEATKEKLRKGEKGTSIHKEYTRLKNETEGVKSDVPQDTAATESDSNIAHQSNDESEPHIPQPNRDQKYFPKTTLKFITHETPRPLLVNLFELFRKGFVEELIVMAMKMLREERGEKVVREIMTELVREHWPEKSR